MPHLASAKSHLETITNQQATAPGLGVGRNFYPSGLVVQPPPAPYLARVRSNFCRPAWNG